MRPCTVFNIFDINTIAYIVNFNQRFPAATETPFNALYECVHAQNILNEHYYKNQSTNKHAYSQTAAHHMVHTHTQ